MLIRDAANLRPTASLTKGEAMGVHKRITLVIERKPEPPALDPFECISCQEMVERDPYHPEWERQPICNRCVWQRPNRLQGYHYLPASMWSDFRRGHAVILANNTAWMPS
jgi:hypothetical protein